MAEILSMDLTDDCAVFWSKLCSRGKSILSWGSLYVTINISQEEPSFSVDLVILRNAQTREQCSHVVLWNRCL
ncbi:hypothetical protein J6590_101381 [Homalodisca vitripennis]|nr:hypothetical protein J6590_101381 [Homalodisca vitripennis]